MPTNDECAAMQGSVRFTCAGPYLLTQEQQQAGEIKRRQLLKLGDQDGLRLMVAAIDAVLHRMKPLPQSPTIEDIDNALIYLLHGRKGCGASLDALIAQLPFDGGEHSVACPSCETVAAVRQPLSDEEAATKVERDAAALTAALT